MGGSVDMNSNTITAIGNAGSQLLADNWTMTSANTQILSLTTTGAAASTYINTTIPAAGTGAAYLRFIQGAGSGDADNQKYTIYYEGNLGLFRLQSESVGPVSTAGVIIEIADDTNDVKLFGGISTDGLTAPTAGISLGGNMTVADTKSITSSGSYSIGADTTLTINAFTLGGTITGGSNTVDSLGHVGIGAAANVDIGLLYSEALTTTDNDTHSGLSSMLTLGKTSAAFTGVVRSAYGLSSVRSSNTQNWTDAVGLRGLHGDVSTLAGSSGTVTGAASVYADATFSATGATVSNYYGLYVKALALVGGSRLTNDYGIW
ncbi:hypothetical protein LCGC14_2569630, partial [marine sediment metagenome]